MQPPHYSCIFIVPSFQALIDPQLTFEDSAKKKTRASVHPWREDGMHGTSLLCSPFSRRWICHAGFVNQLPRNL